MNLLVRRRVLWDRLAGALWVLPTLSVVVFLAAGALRHACRSANDSPLRALAFQGTADDAGALLIVVSTTMITVTGLVFALTIVALQIASGQYSPRLLRNFMRDRGTQLVLSIFVGAFAYSTAGLYTVGVQGSAKEAFVPRLAVSGSLALALASVGVLIYFIHHLSVVLCRLAGLRLGDWTVHDDQGELRAAVPRPKFADYLRLGTAQIRRYGAAEPALTRALIVLLRDVGASSATEDRRQACVRHIHLVIDDARRATAQPADVEAIADEADAALRLLGAPPGPGSRASR